MSKSKFSSSLSFRKARISGKSTEKKIHDYYHFAGADIKLTDSEHRLRSRYCNIWSQLRAYNKPEAIKNHIQWCRENQMDISQRVAYMDLQRALVILHGSENQKLRIRLIDKLEKAINATTDLGDLEVLKRRYDHLKEVHNLRDL